LEKKGVDGKETKDVKGKEGCKRESKGQKFDGIGRKVQKV
jgi:hypothetical protein